ncbi:hypothetical protein ACR79S_19315 [Sphingobacterium spiritivorum]|uniref:hypothetical protein n=1 Tax=Sphingobacterium spiritivorum TaxID=258 RepID=UPI003DA5EDD8
MEVQIEALFSFSMMLINGYPSIRPILYYRHTKEKVILNEKLVQEIYNFYEEWLVTSKETDFKEITWPLVKTPYMWDGEKENIV